VTHIEDPLLKNLEAFVGFARKRVGDFASHEDELQPVLKSLRRAGINILAIHHHMVGETRATCSCTTGDPSSRLSWRRPFEMVRDHAVGGLSRRPAGEHQDEH
jgi:hypothetical protein